MTRRGVCSSMYRAEELHGSAGLGRRKAVKKDS